MLKAYDTFLQVEVFASAAAKNGGLESYRYICATCGEEAILAAINSTHYKPYFKHRHGNNDVECNEYYGQGKATSQTSLIDTNMRAEFYFDKNSKLFYLGLSFSDGEINLFEEKDTVFELRATARGKSFLILSINRANFFPDVPKMLPLEIFSNSYYLSSTFNATRHAREVFKINGDIVPTFFRIQGNDIGYKAKLVRSNVIYTNVRYFITYQGERVPYNSWSYSEITVEETFHFETMGRQFLGRTIIITSKTPAIERLAHSWGYELKASETLTLLWPPSVHRNELKTVRYNSVHLFSSFSLEPYGNINVRSGDIKKIANGVSRVLVNSRIFVRKDNAEIIIEKNMPSFKDFNDCSITETQANIYFVPEQFTHFLFNKTGSTVISHGQSISLTPDSMIKQYRSGYLTGVIHSKQQQILFGQELLEDLLMHYKRVEEFSPDNFSHLKLSALAARYIERCIGVGVINSAAKYFIEEGWL